MLLLRTPPTGHEDEIGLCHENTISVPRFALGSLMASPKTAASHNSFIGVNAAIFRDIHVRQAILPSESVASVEIVLHCTCPLC